MIQYILVILVASNCIICCGCGLIIICWYYVHVIHVHTAFVKILSIKRVQSHPRDSFETRGHEATKTPMSHY